MRTITIIIVAIAALIGVAPSPGFNGHYVWDYASHAAMCVSPDVPDYLGCMADAADIWTD